jgi:hypothetical protein
MHPFVKRHDSLQSMAMMPSQHPHGFHEVGLAFLPVYNPKHCLSGVQPQNVAKDGVAQNDKQNRVTVAINQLPTAAVTGVSSLWSTESLPRTLAPKDEMRRLIAAVTNMASSQPPIPFGSRFLLTNDIVEGGQGVVVFARSNNAAMRPYAIKCASCIVNL